jgi:hypothetical protein
MIANRIAALDFEGVTAVSQQPPVEPSTVGDARLA